MGTTRLQLSYPATKLPVWATDANRTTDPDSTLGLDGEVVKEYGWDISERPPAKVWNWVWNNMYLWLADMIEMPLHNWTTTDPSTFGAVDLLNVVYHPYYHLWFAAATGVNGIYQSYDGKYWTACPAVPASNIVQGGFGIHTTKVIFGTANGLEYGDPRSALTEITNATIGGGFAAGVRTMDSRYPIDARTIVIDTAGVLRIAATGVAGAWTAASTPPPARNTADKRLIYSGVDDKWFYSARVSTEYLYRSLDDGDTWTARGVPNFGVGNGYNIAYDPISGRLLYVGNASTPSIFYSDDEGSSWTDATISGTTGVNYIKDAYSCGNGYWVAIGYQNASPNIGKLFFSRDNAETWELMTWVEEEMVQLMGDGKKLVAIGKNGQCSSSLGKRNY